MRKLIIILLLIIVTAGVTVFNILNSYTFNEERLKHAYFKEKEAILLNFIKKNLFGKNGEIFTNITPTERNIDGYDTMSESIGLLMCYSVTSNNKELFDIEFSTLKKHFLDKNFHIKWKWGHWKAYCNAAIDDLRIIRALIEAYEKWNVRDYVNTVGFIQEEIYNNQVVDGSLRELYDWGKNTANNRIPLCYIDMYTLLRLEMFNSNWREVEERGIEILKSGFFDRDTPILYKYFNYQTGGYMPDEEYDQNKGVCLTYTIYSALHLAEMNEDTTVITDWIKGEMDSKGKLCAWYNPHTLEPAQEMESTAIYALAAVYSKKVGEEKLYRDLLGRMLQFMVTNQESKYYGGFGNEYTGEFYSFDNLTALWALSLLDK